MISANDDDFMVDRAQGRFIDLMSINQRKENGATENKEAKNEWEGDEKE